MNKKIKMIGEGDYKTVPMRVFNEGNFTFDSKFIIQIVSAAGHASYLAEQGNTELKGYANFNTLAKFAIPALEINHGFGFEQAKPDVIVPQHQVSIFLKASELETVQKWVQIKHDHCEKNQDKPEFNKESFYEMKDLLLAVREILLPQPIKEED